MSVVWSDTEDKQARTKDPAAKSLLTAKDDHAYHGEQTLSLLHKAMREIEDTYCVLAQAVALGTTQAALDALDSSAVADYIDSDCRLGYNVRELCAMASHYRDDERFLAGVDAGKLVWSKERGEWVER